MKNMYILQYDGLEKDFFKFKKDLSKKIGIPLKTLEELFTGYQILISEHYFKNLKVSENYEGKDFSIFKYKSLS